MAIYSDKRNPQIKDPGRMGKEGRGKGRRLLLDGAMGQYPEEVSSGPCDGRRSRRKLPDKVQHYRTSFVLESTVRSRRYLHISSPRTQVSGGEFTSTSTVGVQTRSTIRSARLRFIRKTFVEFLMSFDLKMTMGTMMLPRTPMPIMREQMT